MKKVFALILALVMVFAMSSVAFADTVGSVGGSDSGSVTIKYTAAGAPTYHIEITWNLTFTYNADKGVWDVNTHTYESTAGWVDGGLKEIVVVNHSDAAINATAIFNSSATATSNEYLGVTAQVYNTVDQNTNVISLGNAAELSYGDATNAPSGTFTVKVTGTPSVDYEFVMDTVIITITAAN